MRIFEMQVAAAGALAFDAEDLALLNAGGDFDFDVVIVDAECESAAVGGGVGRDADFVRLAAEGWRGRPRAVAAFCLPKRSAKPPPPAAEHLLEDLARLDRDRRSRRRESPRRSAAPRKTAGSSAAARGAAGEPEMVELFFLGLIAENVVGVLDFFELDLGLFVAGVAVGMELPRQIAISLLDLVVRGFFGDSQDFVVIAGHMGVFSIKVVRPITGLRAALSYYRSDLPYYNKIEARRRPVPSRRTREWTLRCRFACRCMMFLQYAILGTWVPVLGPYLSDLHFSSPKPPGSGRRPPSARCSRH